MSDQKEIKWCLCGITPTEVEVLGPVFNNDPDTVWVLDIQDKSDWCESRAALYDTKEEAIKILLPKIQKLIDHYSGLLKSYSEMKKELEDVQKE